MNISPATSSTGRRAEGMSREVYMLTGGQALPSLMPSLSSVESAKPEVRRKWVRTPFKSSARKDGMTLTHWAPLGQPQDEYTFVRFNREVRMVTYTDREYNVVIANLAPLNVDQEALAAHKKKMAELAKLQRSIKANSEKKTAAGVDSATEKDNAQHSGTAATSDGRKSAASGAHASAGEQRVRVEGTGTSRPGASQKLEGILAQVKKDVLAEVSRKEASVGTEQATGQVPGEKGSKKDGGLGDHSAGATASQNSGAPVSLNKSLHFVKPQKPWTKQETDQLFELCKQFDLRFIVVHDRWPDSLSPRTVDELKDRYYSVSKRLIEYRTRSNKDALASYPMALQKHCQAITMNPFDYEYESIRKNQLEWHYRRSKAELREEEETVREARRIEASRKRAAKERQRLARLLTPAPDSAMAPDRKRGVDQALAMAAAAATMPQKTFPHRKVQCGAFARSSMIYTPISQSARISKRIDGALVDLGVGTRPTPTSIVVDNFDLLRMDILAYIELQRTVMRKEEDVHALRVKLAKLKREPPPALPPGVTISHKKRKLDDSETGSLFPGPPPKKHAADA